MLFFQLYHTTLSCVEPEKDDNQRKKKIFSAIV